MSQHARDKSQPQAGESGPAPSQFSRRMRYRRVADAIRAVLIDQRHVGDLLPPERELARRQGVSRECLRRALQLLVGEGWLKRRRSVGYEVLSPKQEQVRTSALFVPIASDMLLTHPFYRDLYLGILQVAERHERPILLLRTPTRRISRLDLSMFWSPNLLAADSLLAIGVFDEAVLQQAADLCPVVCLDQRTDLERVSCVYSDDRIAARMAVKHLFDLGHRRIGYVGQVPGVNPIYRLRMEGFEQEMQQLGLSAGDWVLPRKTDQPSLDEVARRWQRQAARNRPTALVVADYMIWGLLVQLRSAGIRTPQHISLVNIGCVSSWSDYVTSILRSGLSLRSLGREAVPPFTNRPVDLAICRPTVVHSPALSMGRWAMDELLRRLTQPQAEARHNMIEPQLVLGDTTAAPPRD